MCWEVTAAIAASVGVILTVILFLVKPAIQRCRFKTPLKRISNIKDRAIELQNANMGRNLENDELEKFKSEVTKLKKELLEEIGKISKSMARQYENFGAVDTEMFRYRRVSKTAIRELNSEEQIIYLGVVKRCWELTDKIIEKYS